MVFKQGGDGAGSAMHCLRTFLAIRGKGYVRQTTTRWQYQPSIPAILGDGGPGQQGLWRFCRKCRGMFALQDGAIQGVCPADHERHDGSTSLRYAALLGEDAYGQQGGWRWCRNCHSMFALSGTDNGICPTTASQQSGWRWCQKCQGMFSSDDPGQGNCPAGGHHDGSRSLHYAAVVGETTPGQQGGWRWCQKCQGMFSSDDRPG